MSSRYEIAPQWAAEFVDQVRAEHFEELATASILVLFDSQKRKERDRYVVGDLRKVNSIVNTLAALYSDAEYHYALVLDKMVFERMENGDRERLIFHLLCHGFKDTENERDTFNLLNADYAVFGRELLRFSISDLTAWQKKLADFAATCHESKEKPGIKDPRQQRMDFEGQQEGQEPQKPAEGISEEDKRILEELFAAVYIMGDFAKGNQMDEKGMPIKEAMEKHLGHKITKKDFNAVCRLIRGGEVSEDGTTVEVHFAGKTLAFPHRLATQSDQAA